MCGKFKSREHANVGLLWIDVAWQVLQRGRLQCGVSWADGCTQVDTSSLSRGESGWAHPKILPIVTITIIVTVTVTITIVITITITIAHRNNAK